MSKPLWYPSSDFLAQAGHFLIGLLSFAVPLALLPDWKYGAFYGLAAGLAYMLPKEFLFDIFIEKNSFADGVRDLGYLAAGQVAGLSAYGVFALLRFYRQ